MGFIRSKLNFLIGCGILLIIVYHRELLTLPAKSSPETGDLRGISRQQKNFNNNGNTNNNNNNVTKVIILSYMRSGTSFLGKLFDVNNDAFYVFEPLWYLCSRGIPGYETLTYLNGTRKAAPDSCKELGQGVLESFLTCDFENIDTGTLISKWQLMQSRKLQDFAKCGLKAACIKDATRTCEKAGIRAIKTIRLRLADLKPLLEKYPELKVIHLVRDPRGIIHSRVEIREHYALNPLATAIEICGSMLRDAETFKQFRVLFPDRIMRIRYEDFSAQPVEYAQKIYTLLKVPLPESVKEWILENNRSLSSGAYRTSRGDSKKAAYRWRHVISWNLVEAMFKHCKYTYDEYLYDGEVSEANLRNKNFPLRLEMCPGKDNSVVVCPKH